MHRSDASPFMFSSAERPITPRTASSRAVGEILALDQRSKAVTKPGFGLGFNSHLAPRGDAVVRQRTGIQLTPRTAARVSAQRTRFLERYARPATSADISAELARRQEVMVSARRRWEAQQRVAGHNAPQRPNYSSGGTGFRANGGGAVHYSHASPPPIIVNKWMSTELAPEPANVAARNSVKSRPGESIRRGHGSTYGEDGKFHISRHFQDGTLPAERFRRGIPPGYTGSSPMRIAHEQPHKPQGGAAPPVEYTVQFI